MAVLLMAKAPSGSGKSTYFREHLMPKGNWVRVSRDNLRTMLYTKWNKKREQLTMAVQRACIQEIALEQLNIYIDDTNMKPADTVKWQAMAEQIGYKFKVHEIRTPLDVCILRDSERKGRERVGRPVIERQFLTGGFIHWGKRPIAIFDLDDTLANTTHREKFASGPKKDWVKFHAYSCTDPVIVQTVNTLRDLKDAGYIICLVTGRNMNAVGPETVGWLDGEMVPYDHLFMARDSRPGYETKAEIVGEILAQTAPGQVKLVFDDDFRALEMYANLGLHTIPCSREGFDAAHFPEGIYA